LLRFGGAVIDNGVTNSTGSKPGFINTARRDNAHFFSLRRHTVNGVTAGSSFSASRFACQGSHAARLRGRCSAGIARHGDGHFTPEVSGFFARGVFDGSGISGTAQQHQNIESELRKADGSYSRIEGNFESAGGGINASLERAGIPTAFKLRIHFINLGAFFAAPIWKRRKKPGYPLVSFARYPVTGQKDTASIPCAVPYPEQVPSRGNPAVSLVAGY
jgi:hypothetical protein